MNDNGDLRWFNLYRDQLSILHGMNLFRQYDDYICPFCLMTLSYREKEAGLWKADFEKVFKSFRWL